MSAYRDEFDRWVGMWEKAQDSFSKESKPKITKPEQSFFGMNSVSGEEVLDEINENDLNEWRDVIDRTHNLYAPINEVKKTKSKKSKKEKTLTGDVDKDNAGSEEIFSKTKDGVEVTITPNPIHFASKGMDQKMRVTPNWTAGSALAAIAKMKSMMYDLECEMLTAEALGGDVGTLQEKLTALNKQFHAMSEMLTSDPKTDFS